ncbi:MAG: helix-turn-helix transcriptional regulator [Minisyncoccia bacterium]|jgi:cytoskeletal protein RodZ
MDNIDNGEMIFEEFLAARLRDRGISLKRLSETTGIAPVHLENLLHGNFENMPSTPYFHGYLVRIGKVLDFDGEEWWEKIKKESSVKNSGSADKLPRNRFVKKEWPKSAWAIGIISLLIIIYLVVAFPRIFGKPKLTVTYPPQNPFATASTTLTIMGTVNNADALYLSSGNGSSSEEIVIAPDGSWQKIVFISGTEPNTLNTFELTAKKFLGGETTIIEQIIYAPLRVSSSATSGAAFPTIHIATGTPATGTYFD